MKPFFGLLSIHIIRIVWSDCSMMNNCNGNGICNPTSSTCECFEGFGAATDITTYRAPDCSSRTCPADKAWADVPSSNTEAHALAECSNRGTCDRKTGECICFAGFTGGACQRTSCPNNCSGQGACVSMRQMARMSNALPLGPNTYYEGDNLQTTWDEDKIFGCVCESKWVVGLAAGETQEPEWFGPDCSLRHCPSGDDPRTERDETDCHNVKAKDSQYTGSVGNKCHVDCSNRGICDYQTGLCNCFNGYYGENCNSIDARAVYERWNRK